MKILSNLILLCSIYGFFWLAGYSQGAIEKKESRYSAYGTEVKLYPMIKPALKKIKISKHYKPRDENERQEIIALIWGIKNPNKAIKSLSFLK